jgi:hypothetical protein
MTDAAWEFVVRSAIKTSPCLLLADSAPLFEEERNTAPFALIAKGQDPFFLHRSGTGATLATHDHPVDSPQVQFAQVFQQRFD